MIHSHHKCPSEITSNLWPYVILHTTTIINETSCRRINYTSTPTQMFSKSKVNSNPGHWQQLLLTVFELSRPLSLYQKFDNKKEKSTQGIYLGMSTIHSRTVALVLRLLT